MLDAKTSSAPGSQSQEGSVSPALPDYTVALNVAGLDPDRRQRLLDYLRLTGEPVRPGVVRCAATLLATDAERRLSAPTALALAAHLAETPEAGEALIQLYESVMTLSHLAHAGWGQAGLYRGALRQALNYLESELKLLLKLLEER